MIGQGLSALADHPLVGDVRAKGLLAGIELVASKKTKAKFAPDVGLSAMLAKTAYKNKLIFRAFADGTVGFAPPLCITADEVGTLLQRFRHTLDDVLAVKEVRNALD
jgi:adenosylmethionine-8-amino-7-oxononanoate aminotransferase